jgi:hypothetical protein
VELVIDNQEKTPQGAAKEGTFNGSRKTARNVHTFAGGQSGR